MYVCQSKVRSFFSVFSLFNSMLWEYDMPHVCCVFIIDVYIFEWMFLCIYACIYEHISECASLWNMQNDLHIWQTVLKSGQSYSLFYSNSILWTSSGTELLRTEIHSTSRRKIQTCTSHQSFENCTLSKGNALKRKNCASLPCFGSKGCLLHHESVLWVTCIFIIFVYKLECMCFIFVYAECF